MVIERFDEMSEYLLPCTWAQFVEDNDVEDAIVPGKSPDTMGMRLDTYYWSAWFPSEAFDKMTSRFDESLTELLEEYIVLSCYLRRLEDDVECLCFDNETCADLATEQLRCMEPYEDALRARISILVEEVMAH